MKHKIAAKRKVVAKRAVSRSAKPELPKPWTRISWTAQQRARMRKAAVIPAQYELPQPAPRTLPPGTKRSELMAFDDNIIQVNAWANQSLYNGQYFEGGAWLGFVYLSELLQRPEYRRIVEVIATETTRKWIKFHSVATKRKKAGTKIGGMEFGGVADPEAKDPKAAKTERIQQLTDAFKTFDIQGKFRKLSWADGAFGRSHLYVDLCDPDDRNELLMPIGDGQDEISKRKIPKGSLKGFKNIEPVWCYPAKYNSNNPLRGDWYKPQTWFVQGMEVDASRLLTLIAREVPDVLKPTYMFGGLSLSQMAKPYVDRWLRAVSSVSDIINFFSTSIIKMDLSNSLAQDADELFDRLDFFANIRANRGILALDKDKEDFVNVSTPLSTLDVLLAQTEEHLCLPAGAPKIKLLGLDPAGLNASSEGELECWYDHCEAYQESFYTKDLTKVMHFVMLHLWGEIDRDITFSYESMRSDDPKQQAEAQKAKAETDDILIASGTIDPKEARARLAADEQSGYDDIDVDDVPEPPTGPENIDIRGTERPDAVLQQEGQMKEAA